MTRKYFGTDGIRGEVGKGNITPEFFLRLGWAVGKVLAGRVDGVNRGLVLIGKDTRISGYMFESALEAGLISSGVDVGLLGPMPTPAVAFLTRTFQASAGIVISASHNPYGDNGIKLFNTEGTKLADDLELEIEAHLEKSIDTAAELGKAHRIEDAEGRYIEYCKGTLPWGFSLAGMKIVVDCAHGATYEIAPKVFRELGAEVVVTAASPNGLNINLDCGSTSLNSLQQHVLENHANLGIAFDGDGDRLMFVDHKGEVIDGDQLLYIIASHRKRVLGECSGVVGTLMSNFGFEQALKKLDIPFARAKVGDRYVIEIMKKNAWQLGGESSGHIVCADVSTTGDGVVAALQVLYAIKGEGATLNALKQRMQKAPQTMINVRFKNSVDLQSNQELQAAVVAAEEKLEGKGRVLLRPSGTEPVIRVMVEGEDPALVDRLAHELAERVSALIG